MRRIFLFIFQFCAFLGLAVGVADLRTYTVDTVVPPGVRGPQLPTQLPPVFQLPESLASEDRQGVQHSQAPAHWRRTAPKAMQLERFLLEGGEVSLARFQGATGTLLDNINRWLGQLSMSPIKNESQMHPWVETITMEGKEMTLVRLSNTDTRHAMLVAIYFDGGQKWFFKLEGAQDVVDSEETVFLEQWIRSFWTE